MMSYGLEKIFISHIYKLLKRYLRLWRPKSLIKFPLVPTKPIGICGSVQFTADEANCVRSSEQVKDENTKEWNKCELIPRNHDVDWVEASKDAIDQFGAKKIYSN